MNNSANSINRKLFTIKIDDMDDQSGHLHAAARFVDSDFFIEDWNSKLKENKVDTLPVVIECFLKDSKSSASLNVKRIYRPMPNFVGQPDFILNFGLKVYKELCSIYECSELLSFQIMYVRHNVVTCVSYILGCEIPAVYKQDIFKVEFTDDLLISALNPTEYDDDYCELADEGVLQTFLDQRIKLLK